MAVDRDVLRELLEHDPDWEPFTKGQLEIYNRDFVGRLDGDRYAVDYPKEE